MAPQVLPGLMLTFLAALFALPVSAASEKIQFQNFSATMFQGQEAPLNLSNKQANNFRTRLRNAYKEPINFGGRYIVTTWGAGAECETGAILDVATGQPHLLPFALCNTPKGEKGFNFRADSRLLVLTGQEGENGENGTHYFEMRPDGLRKLKTVAAEPAASQNSQLSAESVAAGTIPPPGTIRRLYVTDQLRTEFAKVLYIALFRPALQTASNEVRDPMDAEKLPSMAKILLSTSMRHPLTIGKMRYDLLYNWMADTFILIRYRGTDVDAIGMATGTLISERIYRTPDRENIFESYLKARPAMFKRVAQDIASIDNPDIVFSVFATDEKEALLVRENLLGVMKLLVSGAADPCKSRAKAYLNTSKPTFGGMSLPADNALYTTFGFVTPEGRVLGFADENTNRNIGFIIFDKDDLKSCAPKSVMTSSFH